MEKMRIILTQLMEREGHNANLLARLARVPQSTTFRFLKGIIDDPRSDTVSKWAKLYGITESQLRGDTPIDGINVPEPRRDLKDILPPEEYKLLSNIKKMNPKARGTVYELSEILANTSESSNSCASGIDRRKYYSSSKNQHLRAGEMYHSPQQQNRIKEQSIDTRNRAARA
jgi:predicted transcriptional regulator